MSSFVADLRYAARSLKRSRGFFLLAVTMLAVGIGSTTALFTFVDAVLLRPLPFKEPHSRWWGMTLDPLSEVYVPLEQHSASYGFLIVHSTLGGGS